MFFVVDFEIWKDEMCRKLNVNYKPSGQVITIDGQMRYFHCSGTRICQDNLKSNAVSVVKMPQTCPAQIVVTVTERKVRVVFTKTHIDHSNSIKCSLPRTEIADNVDEFTKLSYLLGSAQKITSQIKESRISDIVEAAERVLNLVENLAKREEKANNFECQSFVEPTFDKHLAKTQENIDTFECLQRVVEPSFDKHPAKKQQNANTFECFQSFVEPAFDKHLAKKPENANTFECLQSFVEPVFDKQEQFIASCTDINCLC